MKKMKRFFALFLAMAMVLGMSMTTFAEGESQGDNTPDTIIGNSDDRGTIKVHGITNEDGITVTAYKIIQAKYDTNGNFAGYVSVYTNVGEGDTALNLNPKEVKDEAGKVTYKIDVTEEQLTTLTNYIKSDSYVQPEGVQPITMKFNSDGTAVAEAPVGSYLVLIENAETKVYNPVVVSIYYTNTDGNGNALDNGEVRLESTENVWVKVSGTPQIEKWMIDEEDETVKGNDVNIGDTVEFMIPVFPIPNYGGSYPVFNIVDTLDGGLSYNNDIAVYVNDMGGELDSGFGSAMLEENKDYTLSTKTVSGKTQITIDFVVNGKYTLNDYTGDTLVVMYTAELTEEAAINNQDGGNENNVVLNYTTDSKTNGNDGTDEDSTYTYTFDIDGGVVGLNTEITTEGILNKTGVETGQSVIIGEKTIENVLENAEFTLYTVNPETFTATENDTLESHIYTNDSFTGTVTSNNKGQLPIKGLEGGTYYLQETKAPESYSLNTHVFRIDINPVIDSVSGKLTSWTIQIDGTTTNTFSVKNDGSVTVNESGNINTVEVPNTKLSELPSTGGIGTTIFTVGGCAIMILAAGMFFVSRRKASR